MDESVLIDKINEKRFEKYLKFRNKFNYLNNGWHCAMLKYVSIIELLKVEVFQKCVAEQ